MPALGSRMESSNASRPSLVPIPESFGPKSMPLPLTWWQVAQVLCGRKKIFSPLAMSPFIATSLAKGGSAWPSPCGGGKSLVACARRFFQRTPRSALPATKLRSAGSRPALASVKSSFAPVLALASPLTAIVRRASGFLASLARRSNTGPASGACALASAATVSAACSPSMAARISLNPAAFSNRRIASTPVESLGCACAYRSSSASWPRSLKSRTISTNAAWPCDALRRSSTTFLIAGLASRSMSLSRLSASSGTLTCADK